jgi:CubicO group peptidase (beta-lactamase class C family)
MSGKEEFVASRGDRVDGERLDARLAATFNKAGAELSGLAVAVIEGGVLVHEACLGRRHIEAADPSRDLPVEPDTKFRVASISKPVAALGAMTLVERGLLDLDRDLSDYLGFEFRNPHHPGLPVTPAMLLSHTSSVRDDGGYIVPLPHRLEDFALRGIEGRGRLAWAAPIEGRDTAPGRYFCYSNLNYGILATVMERVSGERFDLFMRDRVFAPLGIDAGYNVNLLSDEGFGKLAALYRKAEEEGAWRSCGPWIPQVDDYRGKRPEVPFRAVPGLGAEALAAYEIGTNGSIFSPQGGLRISLRDLAKILRLFIGGGEVDGCRLLSRASVELMTTTRWTWDPLHRNGELYSGLTRETGLGLARTTAARDEQGGDCLLPSGGPRLWGHHADAYGLLGGMLFDPREGYGFVYLIGGTACAPERLRGRYSSWFLWEEEIQAAILGAAGRGEPWRTGLWRWRGAVGETGCFSLDGVAATGRGLVLDPTAASRRDGLLVGSATSPELLPDFPVSEVIPSWNADCPEGSRLDIFLRGRCRGQWAPWYALGEWCGTDGPFSRRSIGGQDDAFAQVRTDTLSFASAAEALQLRCDLAMCDRGEWPAESSLPAVRNLALAFSERKENAKDGPREVGDPGLLGRVIEGVPAFSQMVYPDGGNTWCSPTCVAMVLSYWEGAKEEAETCVRRAVADVFDPTWGGCGNWAFNAAFAGGRGFDALVARFSSLARLEPFVAAGMPVALSISWNNEAGRPLSGAPVARSAGHLTLLVGFDAAGDPVMNEPAARDPSGVRLTYRRDELESRWLESSGGAVYLIAPAGKPLPGIP